MKDRNIFRNFNYISIFVMCAALMIFSCTNFSSDNTFHSSGEKIKLTGTLTLPDTEGAVPLQMQEILSSLGQYNSNSVTSERAATVPSFIFDTTKHSYYAEAVKREGGQKITEVTWHTGVDGTTFSMELDYGTWDVTAGIKNISDGFVIYSSTEPVTIVEGGPKSYSKNFVAKPKQTTDGQGKLDLTINIENGCNIFFAEVNFLSGNSASWNTNFSTTNNSNLFGVSDDWDIKIGGDSCDLKSGMYTVQINFYDYISYEDSKKDEAQNAIESGEAVLVYSTIQTLNIYDNLTTNRWINSTDPTIPNSSPIGLVGYGFFISKNFLEHFVFTNICISSNGSDSNMGTVYNPYKTLGKAISYINSRGSSDKDFTVLISGDVECNTEISLTSGKANSLTIKGKSGNNDKLNGASKGRVLKINTTIPITIENLTITGGDADTDLNGGGILIEKSGAKVILGDNTKIIDNEANNGGGVYVSNGTTLEITGSAQLTGNKANIVSNSGGNGGAVYNDGTLTMSAGTVGGSSSTYQNTAASYGGAVYQNGTFYLSGSANLYFSGNTAGTNDVYQAASTKYITVNDTLNGSSKIATITPYTKERGKQVLVADGTKVEKITSGIAGRFAVSDAEWSVTDHSNVGKIDAELWVSGTGYASTSGVGSGSDSNIGTKSKPFSSIKTAAEHCWASDKDFTIHISGMITGSTQELPATDTTNGKTLANKITLTGFTGNTKDGINRGLANSDAVSGGSALIINFHGYTDITNLKIMGGNTTDNGGGIQIKGTSPWNASTCPRVNLKSGTLIQQNQAVLGGGVYSYYSILSLSGSATIGTNADNPDRSAADTALSTGINKASTSGGGIYSLYSYLYLGAAWISGAPVTDGYTLTKGIYGNVCTVSSSATDYEKKRGAGGLYLASGPGYFLSGNINCNYGILTGGVYNNNNKTSDYGLHFSGGSIHKNTGLGVYNDTNGQLCMCGSACIGDSGANSVATSDTDCSNSKGGLQNMGITNLGYGYGSKSKLSGGIIRNYGGSGAGITNKGTLLFDSGTIAYNCASTNGGGIYSTTTVNMTSSSASQYSSITNNSANNGGGLFLSGPDAKLFMTGYAIIGTNGQSAPPANNTVSGINKAKMGGGIYAESGASMYFGYSSYTDSETNTAVTLNGGVCYNYASQYGGGIYCNGYVSAIEIRMNSGNINANKTYNTSTSYGMGGGVWMNYSCDLYMSGGTINKNSASRFGGGVYLSKDARLFMYGTALIGETGTTLATDSSYGNTAITGGGVYAKGEGGGNEDKRPRVLLGVHKETGESISFTDLDSDYGIRRNYASGAISDIEYTVNNVAPGTGFGGGVYCEHACFYAQTGTVGYNLATKGGGVTILGSYESYGYWPGLDSPAAKIIGNKATDNGGGVYVKRQSFRVYGSVVNNVAGGNGGGIYNHVGSIDISHDDAKVDSNNAVKGGGIYSADGTGDDNSGNIEFTAGSISYNQATLEGGGVYSNNYNDYFSMEGGTMAYNYAGSCGGAVSGLLKIKGTVTFTYNPAYEGKKKYNDIYCDGSTTTRAIDFVGTSANVTLSNNLYITLGSSFNTSYSVVGSGSSTVSNYSKYKLTTDSTANNTYKIGNYGTLVLK